MTLLLLRAVVWQERGPAAASEVVVVAPSGSFAHHISGGDQRETNDIRATCEGTIMGFLPDGT